MALLISASLRNFVAELNGPRFFAFWTSLSLENDSLRDMTYLQIGAREFITVITTSHHVHVYEIARSSFNLFQTLSSSGTLTPSGVEAISVDGRYCIAITGGRSALFCWNAASQRFDEHQELFTREAVHVRFVSAGTYHFLVFACNGSSDAPSYVYVWSSQSDRFLLFQHLPTVGGVSASVQSTSIGSFITITQRTETAQSCSMVFKWNGTYFDYLQSFHSNTTFVFAAGEIVFLISSATVHRYDFASGQFITHSTLPIQRNNSINNAYDYFSINTEHYLAVGGQQLGASGSHGTIDVHRLDGASFVPYQTVQAPSGLFALQGFQSSSGRKVLAFTSGGNSMSFYRWTTSDSP